MAFKGVPVPCKQFLNDEDFKREFVKLGAGGMARDHGMNERSIQKRRKSIQFREGVVLSPPTRGGHIQQLDSFTTKAGSGGDGTSWWCSA